MSKPKRVSVIGVLFLLSLPAAAMLPAIQQVPIMSEYRDADGEPIDKVSVFFMRLFQEPGE